jgi:hypothetical protein
MQQMAKYNRFPLESAMCAEINSGRHTCQCFFGTAALILAALEKMFFDLRLEWAPDPGYRSMSK